MNNTTTTNNNNLSYIHREYNFILIMGIADAGDTGDMSPALPVSVPLWPSQPLNYFQHIETRVSEQRLNASRVTWSSANCHYEAQLSPNVFVFVRHHVEQTVKEKRKKEKQKS